MLIKINIALNNIDGSLLGLFIIYIPNEYYMEEALKFLLEKYTFTHFHICIVHR